MQSSIATEVRECCSLVFDILEIKVHDLQHSGVVDAEGDSYAGWTKWYSLHTAQQKQTSCPDIIRRNDVVGNSYEVANTW